MYRVLAYVIIVAVLAVALDGYANNFRFAHELGLEVKQIGRGIEDAVNTAMRRLRGP